MTREEAIKAFEEIRENAQNNLGAKWAYGCDGYYRDKIELADVALSALRPVSREQVEQVWRGEWILDEDDGKYQCDNCKIKFPVNYNFCPYCGSAKTEKAMQKVIWKLERIP